jgi:hypothetical protein
MWPFSILRKRRYQRSFDAALVIFLAADMFDRMNFTERAQIDSEVDKILKSTTIPSAAHRHCASPEVRALYRALAMAHLGVQPTLRPYTWKSLMRHWRLMPLSLYLDYRPYAQPTWDAEEFLRKNGIEVPNDVRSSVAA